MPRLIADENVRVRIVRGVLRRLPNLDFLRAQEAGLTRTADPTILEWAAANGRPVVTQDVNTMPGHAYERVAAGLPMPGVVVVPEHLPIGPAIEDLVTLIECSFEGEWERRVIFLPL